jgi:hypothetical protein
MTYTHFSCSLQSQIEDRIFCVALPTFYPCLHVSCHAWAECVSRQSWCLVRQKYNRMLIQRNRVGNWLHCRWPDMGLSHVDRPNPSRSLVTHEPELVLMKVQPTLQGLMQWQVIEIRLFFQMRLHGFQWCMRWSGDLGRLISHTRSTMSSFLFMIQNAVVTNTCTLHIALSKHCSSNKPMSFYLVVICSLGL